MNREDVAMDVTFENMDLLRKEVQAAKLLLSECDEIFIEEGISSIELRGYLSGKLCADEVIELLASQQGEQQVDLASYMKGGVSERDWPEDFQHENGQYMCRCHECENTFIGYKRRVTCKACANKHPEQAEGAQGEREVTPNPSCSMCSGNGYFCEFSTVETCWCCLPDPEPEETVEALKERIESLKAGVTHMKQQRDAAVARAALAQPSPAPELPSLTPGEMENLHDFYGSLCDGVGHRVEKEGMRRLAELGAVESVGFGKHRLTKFGEYLLGIKHATVAQDGQVPDECPHLILFDDADVEPIMFAGSGARRAALAKWEQVSINWNAHLFVRIEKNCRDDRYPCATLAAAPAQRGE